MTTKNRLYDPAKVQHRTFQLRAAGEDTEAREVEGIAVPWDDPCELWPGLTESFARGACEARAGGVLLFDRHATPIGTITRHEDGEDGWEVTGKVSRTSAGDDALTLARDGVYARMSVGFRFIEWTEDNDAEGNVHVTVTRAEVMEVSLVPFPAYEGAVLTDVRERPTDPRTTPREDTTVTESTVNLEDVRGDVADLARRFDAFAAGEDGPQSAPSFRSFGDYVKALAAGDEAAARAFEGAVSGDTVVKDAWIGDVIKVMREKQRITNLFTHSTNLPAEGMNVEYARLLADTTKVAEQENEGDDLLYGKVRLTTESARVKTLGGYTELSRQAIERATVPTLTTTFEAMAQKYARAVEVLTRRSLTAGYATATRVEGTLEDQDSIVDLLLDLVEHFDDHDQNLSGLLLSKDAFRALARVPAEKRMLQIVAAPTDKAGTLNVSSLEADLSGITASVWPGAPAGAICAYDSVAIRTMESAGAPMRLQDDNVVNLSRAFSVYGYAASFVQQPAGLVRVGAAAEGAPAGTVN